MLLQVSDTLSQKKLSHICFKVLSVSITGIYILKLFSDFFFHFCLHNALNCHSFILLLSEVESYKVIASFFSIKFLKIL